MSRNYSGYGQPQRGTSLSPFGGVGNDEPQLYGRHSLGGVFEYGETTVEPCRQCVRYPSHGLVSRADLTLSNLQDVMEDNVFGNPSQSLGPSNPVGTPLTAAPSMGKPSPLSHSQMLGGTNSLFGQSTDGSLGSFGPMPSLMRPELSPPLGGLSCLTPPSNSFLLNSFDNEDYGGHCK